MRAWDYLAERLPRLHYSAAEYRSYSGRSNSVHLLVSSRARVVQELASPGWAPTFGRVRPGSFELDSDLPEDVVLHLRDFTKGSSGRGLSFTVEERTGGSPGAHWAPRTREQFLRDIVEVHFGSRARILAEIAALRNDLDRIKGSISGYMEALKRLQEVPR